MKLGSPPPNFMYSSLSQFTLTVIQPWREREREGELLASILASGELWPNFSDTLGSTDQKGRCLRCLRVSWDSSRFLSHNTFLRDEPRKGILWQKCLYGKQSVIDDAFHIIII
jgi:hypothetical protein